MTITYWYPEGNGQIYEAHINNVSSREQCPRFSALLVRTKNATHQIY